MAKRELAFPVESVAGRQTATVLHPDSEGRPFSDKLELERGTKAYGSE